MMFEATPYVAAGAAVLLSGAVACESGIGKKRCAACRPRIPALTPFSSPPTDAAQQMMPKTHSQREKALLK